MNRLKDFFSEPSGEEPANDYWQIETHCDSFAVSLATAQEVERALERKRAPKWVTFQSLTGSRHRLRTRLIERVSESTAAQRAVSRAFYRARKLEAKADKRPWEDDD